MMPHKKFTLKIEISLFLTVLLVYLVLFFSLEKLRFTPLWDEPQFWKTSLQFSHSLIPSLSQLRNYGELNTPLPFIIFGVLEYLFKGGIFAGRLLNLVLSFLMTYLICLSPQRRYIDSLLVGCGLLLFPYYLWLSGHLYTDIIATLFVFFGFWFYCRSQNIISSLSFILAIAARQYMLAFPLAVAAFELFSARKNKSKLSIRWLVPLIASLSIVGWFVVFNGIAPTTAIAERNVPTVQLSLWSVQPNASLYFLACIGLYFVIPEFILFHRRIDWQSILTRQNGLLALGLLFLFVIFPPLEAHGLLIKVEEFLPNNFFKIGLFYSLAFLTCARFSRFNLAFWILLMNCGLMMKAYPWDKYALPLLVVFWYLKSIRTLDKEVPYLLKPRRESANTSEKSLKGEQCSPLKHNR